MAIVIEAVELMTALPKASSTAIVGGPEIELPEVEFPGCTVKASFVAAPAFTLNPGLSPLLKLSPLVRLAVTTTPLSALV